MIPTPSRTIAKERRCLLAYGMTVQEVEIWLALGKVAGALLELPTLHASEQVETARDIHNLQSRLVAKPGLRALGWDR